MKKLLLAIAVSLCVAAPVAAQTQAPVYKDRNGNYQGATGVIILNGDGSATNQNGANAPQTQGNVASGTTDAGNPEKIGCVYLATPTSVASGQRVDVRCSQLGQQFVIGQGGSTIVTGQVSVGTTATLVAAARTARQKVGVSVTTAVQCAFGNAGVTLTTGWPLAAVAYASDSWDTGAALYAVCASTATVAYREQF